jgi:hypothetical protein
MADTNDTQADGYYAEEAPTEEFDLSFLDDEESED